MNKKSAAKRVAFMGMLFALALALTYLESLLPPLPLLPAGFKLGLSNIVTMYCLYFVGYFPALLLCFLKASFSFMLRGFTAFALSLAGGVLSVSAMALLVSYERKGRLSKSFISIVGALSHNAGQLAMCCFLLKTWAVLYYAPVLIIAGIALGLVTGATLEASLSALSRIKRN